MSGPSSEDAVRYEVQPTVVLKDEYVPPQIDLENLRPAKKDVWKRNPLVLLGTF